MCCAGGIAKVILRSKRVWMRFTLELSALVQACSFGLAGLEWSVGLSSGESRLVWKSILGITGD